MALMEQSNEGGVQMSGLRGLSTPPCAFRFSFCCFCPLSSSCCGDKLCSGSLKDYVGEFYIVCNMQVEVSLLYRIGMGVSSIYANFASVVGSL